MVAVALSAAGAGLWSGRWPRSAVLLLGAAGPAVLLAAAPSSSDLGGLAAVAVLGWLFLRWQLRRPDAAGWLGRRHDHS